MANLVADLTITKGDYGYYLGFTVKQENEDESLSIKDLTDYTVTLKAWEGSNSANPILSGACAIVVAASGTCRYLVTATDFTSRDYYNAKLQLTKTGALESTKVFTIWVKESA